MSRKRCYNDAPVCCNGCINFVVFHIFFKKTILAFMNIFEAPEARYTLVDFEPIYLLFKRNAKSSKDAMLKRFSSATIVNKRHWGQCLSENHESSVNCFQSNMLKFGNFNSFLYVSTFCYHVYQLKVFL